MAVSFYITWEVLPSFLSCKCEARVDGPGAINGDNPSAFWHWAPPAMENDSYSPEGDISHAFYSSPDPLLRRSIWLSSLPDEVLHRANTSMLGTVPSKQMIEMYRVVWKGHL